MKPTLVDTLRDTHGDNSGLCYESAEYIERAYALLSATCPIIRRHVQSMYARFDDPDSELYDNGGLYQDITEAERLLGNIELIIARG